MKWKKYTLKTTTEAEDIISNMMMEAGIEGIEIEDKVPLSERDKEQMFVDILPDMPEDDGVAYISFYLEPEMDQAEVLDRVRAGLKEIQTWGLSIGEGTITSSETEDKDWINNWKEYFHQFYVDDILIKPSWEETKPEDRDKLLIQIDPGTAFGTGMHETTQLCIRQIRKHLTDHTVLLDVGTGSGILSVISLKLGAEKAKGTDLDPCAVDAVRENLEANAIDPDSFELRIGNIIDDQEVQDWAGYECYDIVVANILAEVLVPLTPVVLKHLKPGGIYITSGIIDDKEELVVKTVKECGFEVLEVTYQGEWVSVTARKP
ncbi:MAG: 50S ribosomal protein L11 methyltransferase [Lachnospiraceae bacterium]|nr:50S ribosomal protein L11 methyltransferase [Lachnospiraceae bacterium]MCI9623463.1 50S ribosomal protein L11 methyltransferase [Lachnospiraceae bacterium]